MLTNNPQHFMSLALRQAKEAALASEVPVGAVLVKNNKVISEARNSIEEDKSAASHAEIKVIAEAGKKLGDWRLHGCSLFVTLEPCTMCIGAIRQARVSEVYFAAFDQKFGAVGSLYDLSSEIAVYSGIMEEESQKLLGDFFQKLRH